MSLVQPVSTSLPVSEFYSALSASLDALVSPERDGLAQLANACALIADCLTGLSEPQGRLPC